VIEDDLGYWWPVGNDDARALAYRKTRIANARKVADFVRAHVPVRRQCVQAGGHVGLWPKHLALLFEHVYTFEPNAANFAALAHNILEPNVYAARGVLGAYHRLVGMVNPKGESGTHRVGSLTGATPTYRIDDLGLRKLDLIVLDVEGYELPALMGAEQTIRHSWPSVILEVGGHNSEHGNGDAVGWLRSMGYGLGETVCGYDLYFTRDGR
jgi:FkbM family methyltransferase